MQRPLLLLTLSLLCTLPLALAQTADNFDCRLQSLTFTTNLGTNYVYTPPFDKDITDYVVSVPYAVSKVVLTGTTIMAGNYYIGYSNTTATSDGKLVAQGDPVITGTPGPELGIAVGSNKLGAMTTCSFCRKLYKITVTRATMSYTKGDPLFAGLLGQQFQVHGVAGEVYSVISSPDFQMNSRFVFLSKGDCPILHGRKASACWSHPGSYLGEIGIKTLAGDRVHIASGSARNGFAKVHLNGRSVEMDTLYPLPGAVRKGEDQFGTDGFIVRNSTHLATVQLGPFLLQIENSDKFVNYRVRVLDWDALPGTHGLLGQTFQPPPKPGKQIKHIEGNVDDYMILDKDLFGDEFTFNRFQSLEEQ